MVTDQIADLLTRIRNAQNAGHPTVTVPSSKEKLNILKLLETEGFISRILDEKSEEGHPITKIMLKYTPDGDAVINEIKRISTPGRRMYVQCKDIPKVRGGLGIILVSTSKGVVSDREARKLGVGGELICSVF